jgi:peptide/nickel transport system ATP-binding protein
MTEIVLSEQAAASQLVAIPAPAVLRVRDLCITYGTGARAHAAVRRASFDIAPGERVGIVGESGSGKTTLGLAVAGLLTAADAHVSADQLEFDGQQLDRSTTRRVPVRTPGLSMVLQDAMTSLDPVATIGSQFTAVMRGVQRVGRRAAREQAAEWLTQVGITDVDRVLRLRPYELSGGMSQRVMVALAMCSRPRLLIADEPTSALDASVSRDVMDLLLDMTVQQGASLLMVTHDIELCREYTDRMVVMYQGEVVDVCRSDAIATQATSDYTRALLACVPTLDTVGVDRLPTLEGFPLQARDSTA